ncbi:hypothetical protein FACS18948_1760 [Clostridia bacterium]|nr:hypothetical protein FACS18948_1760 [Clostridia bacterium]
MILPQVRDKRFMLIRRGGMMTNDTHRLLALWASDCAEHVLPIYEAVCPNDERPRRAIEAAHSWAAGKITVTQSKEAAGISQNAARDLTKVSEAAKMAALSAGQAAVVAHVAAHELGAAAYAIRAVMETSPNYAKEAARISECEWQRSRLPDAIRELVLDDQRLRDDICWFVFTGSGCI